MSEQQVFKEKLMDEFKLSIERKKQMLEEQISKKLAKEEEQYKRKILLASQDGEVSVTFEIKFDRINGLSKEENIPYLTLVKFCEKHGLDYYWVGWYLNSNIQSLKIYGWAS